MPLAIEVDHVSKKFRVGAARLPYGSLRETLTRAVCRLVSPGSRETSPPREHWALRDVSFEVESGDIVGIIGRNGAGKSTLLKVLSRITPPSHGRARLRGRVGSLLEVGTGFHPELTGRENVFLNGAILGMRRQEIRARLEEILAFAEIEEYADTPVKHYSSGMYMRLAFSVAAHLLPEILLVDEVLAVGDAEFQRKCLGRMGHVAREGRTVLFVSHNLQAVSTLCSRGIYLRDGTVAHAGTAREAVDAYLADIAVAGSVSWTGTAGGPEFLLHEVRADAPQGGPFTTDQEIRVRIRGEVLQPLYGFICGLEIWSSQQQFLAYTAYDDSEPPPPVTVPAGPFSWECVIPPNTLGEGSYEIRPDIGLHRKRHLVDRSAGVLILAIENPTGLGRRYTGSWTHILRPGWHWRKLQQPEPTPPAPRTAP